MLKKYWKYCGFGELKSHVIEDNLCAWEKEQEVVKAETFKKDELLTFYKNTIEVQCAENLLLSTYTIIGNSKIVYYVSKIYHCLFRYQLHF
jgi:hypothetical protein